MSRQLRCPNCGGEHSLVNPGISMLVCDFCSTVVYWDQETALQTGKKSILPEGDTRLFMHATGSLAGRPYEVVGHLSYQHGAGTWDEWYLQLGDGGVAWVSEDERKLSLELPVAAPDGLPPLEELHTGFTISLAGTGYTVRELGQATCVGGEGQLPFAIQPDEQYRYADLASLDGASFATLEYDKESAPTCFAGQVLSHEQLTIDDERPPSTAGGHEGRNIKCPNCDAALEVTGSREVKTQVCDYCGAQNDLTGAEAKVMGVNPQDYDPGFYFEIGQGGTFDGSVYEVCGRILSEDDEGYLSREYLLHNPDAGYLWLSEENNHYLLNRPTQQAPNINPFYLAAKQTVKAGGRTYQFYESGTTRLVYVDGALPWQASSGDRNSYADLIAPPYMFQVEQSEQEVEYFIGEYITVEQVWNAFSSDQAMPSTYGVHPAQPFSRGPMARTLMTLGGLFALLNLLLLGWSLGSGGEVIFNKKFSANDYLKESLSEPFTVGPQRVMGLKIAAPLNNSWLALQVALVNSADQVVQEMESDISYYQGVEGGESWSEGSRTSTTYGIAPPPGTYRLLFKGAGGTGNAGSAGQERLQVALVQGVVLTRYFLAAFIITLLFPLFEIVRKRMFETRRWAAVIEDDDD